MSESDDPYENFSSGRALVARTIMAPHVALDLRDQLDEAWRNHNQWSMPGVGS